MIDYFETKSQPITRAMVVKAYSAVKSNKGSGGIDCMDWKDLDKDLTAHLYKLWNRLTSGSYFPLPVKEVEIKKKDGGARKLGIPTLLDRIAQEVVKSHLERIVEPLFHESSFGYRPGRSCHDAVNKAQSNIMTHDWAIDLDIKSFFDTIDHDLMMQALEYYCKEEWVLMYVKRWLKAGTILKSGMYIDKTTGTPQGGVISPLLSNIFLHVVLDKWMEKEHPEKPFVRYADDAIVHCKTEKQAKYVQRLIEYRLRSCKLELNLQKTKIINLRGKSENKYPRSLDFLGFTLKPRWTKTNKGHKIMISQVMSRKSKSSVMEKFRKLQIHKRRKSLIEIAKTLNPITRGVINYYCKVWSNHTRELWYHLNCRLIKWLKWEKGLFRKRAVGWLKNQYKQNPNLFYHWRIAIP